MSLAPEMMLSHVFAQAYRYGFELHGDIDLSVSEFEEKLEFVTTKHLGSAPSLPERISFIRGLHCADLYLACACSHPSDRAWICFLARFEKYINDLARSMTSSHDKGAEIASDVQSNLYMHDRAGKSRIASYDGHQSLATWLRAVVAHRVTNEVLQKWNTFEAIDNLCDIEDKASRKSVEANLRANAYRKIIPECFLFAIERLSVRERLILLMRFEQGLRVVEIAQHFGVHPSGITRQLQQIYGRLRKKMIGFLSVQRQLSPEAINECLTDILENPEHSIILLIREVAERDDKRLLV